MIVDFKVVERTETYLFGLFTKLVFDVVKVKDVSLEKDVEEEVIFSFSNKRIAERIARIEDINLGACQDTQLIYIMPLSQIRSIRSEFRKRDVFDYRKKLKEFNSK